MEIRDPKLDEVPTLTMALLCVVGACVLAYRVVVGTPGLILKRPKRKRVRPEDMTPAQRASYLLALQIKEQKK
jgi:hypothetical protein